jgi:hypothetical protein
MPGKFGLERHETNVEEMLARYARGGGCRQHLTRLPAAAGRRLSPG